MSDDKVLKKREEIRNTQIGKLKTKDFLKNNGCLFRRLGKGF